MNQITLPRFARMRRNAGEVGAEAVIPVATAPHTTTAAAHLADDRHREPSFDDLIAGNDREPSHEDLLADDDEFPDAARDEFTAAYPGVAADAIAWLRSLDTEPTPPAAPVAVPALPADHDEHAYDVDHLVPANLRVVDLAQLDTDANEAPTVPAGNPRLLFDALDALDQLPALADTDAAAFQLATNAAAVLTRLALNPELLARPDVAMILAPLTAELAEVSL